MPTQTVSEIHIKISHKNKVHTGHSTTSYWVERGSAQVQDKLTYADHKLSWESN